MVACDPVHLDVLGQLAQGGQYFPVGFGKPPHIKRIEDVPVQDQATGGQSMCPGPYRIEKTDHLRHLRVVSTQMQVGEDQRVMHGLTSLSVGTAGLHQAGFGGILICF